MGLFSKNKEKNDSDGCCQTTKEKSSCCCGGECTPESIEKAEASKASGGIKILGSGCQKCNDLEAAARDALLELGMNDTIEHVTDLVQIACYGVMSTPALVIDNKVVSLGKALKKDEVIKLIQKYRG